MPGTSAWMIDLQRGQMEALQIHQRFHRALLHHQRLHCCRANQRQRNEGADDGGERDEGAGGSAAPPSARAAVYEESRSAEVYLRRKMRKKTRIAPCPAALLSVATPSGSSN